MLLKLTGGVVSGVWVGSKLVLSISERGFMTLRSFGAYAWDLRLDCIDTGCNDVTHFLYK